MGLETYRSCSAAEKRLVLATFWSRKPSESDKVLQAAREYGPYDVVMVGLISLELGVIAAALFASGSAWAWFAGAATLAGAICTLLARDRRRDVANGPAR